MTGIFHPYVVTGYLTSIVTIAVGLFVYAKDKQSPVHRSFLWFSISIWQWSFFTALHAMQEKFEPALFLSKACHIGAMLIPVFFYYFTMKITGRRRPAVLKCGFTVGFLLIALNFLTPYFSPGLRTNMGPNYFTKAGPYYFLMILFFSTYVLLALWELWREIGRSKGARKKHLIYFFTASVVGFGIGVVNFCPVYGITIPPYPYSASCGAIYSCVIAYAILRHKLFDIEVMIKKGLIFGTLFGAVYAAVSGIIFLAGYLLAKPPLSVLSGISIALAMLLYEPLKGLLTRLTNSFLFQKKISYTSLIHTLTDKLTRISDTHALAEEITDFLNEHMALEWSALYLRDENGGGFKFESAETRTPWDELLRTDPLLELIARQTSPLILSPFDTGDNLKTETKIRLRSAGIEAAIPIFVEETLYGILLLGKKKSDETFSGEDEALLQTLMDEVGMFFLSAKLLKEATRSNLELAQRTKMAAVRQLARGVHHDVRNPLHAIVISSDAIIDKLPSERYRTMPDEVFNKELDGHLGQMLRNVDRIKTSLGRFAQFARPEDNFDLEPLSLKSELDKFLGIMREGQKLDHIKVEATVPEELYVLACEGILQEIFFNLFNNAYEAMHGKGSLFFSATNGGDFVALKIRDSGPGIPKAILGDIFEPYFTTKTESEAAGIGLSITKLHTDRLEGSIEASRDLNQGAEFIIKFKQAKEAPLLCEGF